MQVTETSLRDRFREMESDELVRRMADGTLTEAAMVLAMAELDSRGVTPEQHAEVKAKLESITAASTAEWLASPGSRLVSQVIDGLIAFALLIVPVFVGGEDDTAVMFGLAGFCGYLLLADAMPRGQSLGKRVMGTAVIDRRTQRPCGIAQSVARNILGVLGIIDWIFIFSRMRQRLGDRAANTIVVNRTVHLGDEVA